MSCPRAQSLSRKKYEAVSAPNGQKILPPITNCLPKIPQQGSPTPLAEYKPSTVAFYVPQLIAPVVDQPVFFYRASPYPPLVSPFPPDASILQPGFYRSPEEKELIIDPKALGFVPKKEWTGDVYTLYSIQERYFKRRNGNLRRFDVKLCNALLITSRLPQTFPVVGVMWLTENIIKVDARKFAQFLGITVVQGGLFHKQGNFVRHNFTQVLVGEREELQDDPRCADVDNYNIRLFVHNSGQYARTQVVSYLERQFE